MFVDSYVVVHIFVCEVVALSVLVREIMDLFFHTLEDNYPEYENGPYFRESYFPECPIVTPAAPPRNEKKIQYLTNKDRKSNDLTNKKICTTTYESTNMYVLASSGKHSKSYRPSRSSPSRKEHGLYLTPHKFDRVFCYKKQIDLDSSFILRYRAPILVRWLMRKLPEPETWTLKNFLFWTPWPISHARYIEQSHSP